MIYKELIKKGILADRMIFSGYGEANPIVENSTEENRKRNRRVEIIFKK